jgi:nicotinamide mononucleotide transporter
MLHHIRILGEGTFFGAVLTALTIYVARQFEWILEIDSLEAITVFISYACTWAFTRRSWIAYPLGIISTALQSVLYYQWGLPALSIFNLYLVGSLVYGWVRWGFDWGPDEEQLPVTDIDSVRSWMGYGLFGMLLFLGFYVAINLSSDHVDSEAYRVLVDALLASASGVAQLMLDNKKRQTWLIWIGINVLSIPFFIYVELYLIAFQFAFFLINAFIGYMIWTKSMKGNESGNGAVHAAV